MTSDSNLVAFIIGAGPGIGAAVAANLRDKGYKVALGNRRSPSVEERTSGYFFVQVDASKRETIEAAFDTVVKELGPVNVVVYNAVSVAVPPIPTDILSLPADSYFDAAAIGIGAFIAAQKALVSFKSDVHHDHAKVFIATGNLRPFTQASPPSKFTLGIQKALQTRFISTAVESYKDTDIKFYFATLVADNGGIPSPDEFEKGASTHAQVYWKLINNKEQIAWDHKFTLDGEAYQTS